MTPKVEVWHGDDCTFRQEFRSTVAARRVALGRVEDALRTGFVVTVTLDADWWTFTASRDDVSYRIQLSRDAF